MSFELICRTETDSQTLKNLKLAKGTGVEVGGVDWGFGVGICPRGIWNDWSVGTCCIAQRTLPSILRKLCGRRFRQNGYVCMYDWVALLYSRNYHSLVN